MKGLAAFLDEHPPPYADIQMTLIAASGSALPPLTDEVFAQCLDGGVDPSQVFLSDVHTSEPGLVAVVRCLVPADTGHRIKGRALWATTITVSEQGIPAPHRAAAPTLAPIEAWTPRQDLGGEYLIRDMAVAPDGSVAFAVTNTKPDESLSHSVVRTNRDGTEIMWGPALPSQSVRRLAFDDAGGLWAATLRGVALLNDDGSCELVEPEALPWPAVDHLVHDDQGNQWFGTTHGVARRSREGLVDRVDGFAVHSLVPDGEGGAWMGILGGLVRLDTGLKQIAHVDCPPRRFSGRALPTAVRAMAPGEHGPWVLVDGQVFQVLHDQLKADSRTSRMSVRRMVSDRNGGAWLDCLDGSLAHLPPKGPLRRFGLALHGGLAANLVAAADGSVWIDNHRFKPNRSNEL